MLKHLLILLLGFGCFAQTKVIPIFSNDNDWEDLAGGYLKDTYNDFDNFTGTWKYQSGSTIFIIKLNKKINWYDISEGYHQDIVYGEYQYIENGIEKVNTLPLLTSPFPDPYDHHIHGNIMNTTEKYPPCTTCPPGQKRLHLSFTDPVRGLISALSEDFILRRVDSGGIQKLEVWVYRSGQILYNIDGPPPNTTFNVPSGTYVLTKVN